MQNVRKVSMRQVEGVISFVPIEEINDCDVIIIDNKTTIVVCEKEIPGGASDSMGDETIFRKITEEDIATIISNKGECFVEVDAYNKLSMPSNAFNDKLLVLHLVRTAIEDEDD